MHPRDRYKSIFSANNTTIQENCSIAFAFCLINIKNNNMKFNYFTVIVKCLSPISLNMASNKKNRPITKKQKILEKLKTQ